MAIPTLSQITSVNFLYRGRPVEINFTLSAGTLATTGTVWQAENLPTGLSINALTGLISGTPTVNGCKKVRVRARGSGSSDWSAWMVVPFGVVDPPTEDTTQGATRVRYNLQTDLVYNPLVPSDPVLRLTTNDKVILALHLEEDGIIRKLPYFGRVKCWLKRNPDDTGIFVGGGQPVLKRQDGSWNYQFLIDLTGSSVLDMVEENLEGENNTASLLMAIQLEFYGAITLDPDPDPLKKSSQPFVVLVTKAFDA